MAHIRERRPGVWQVMFDAEIDPVSGRRRQRSRTIHGTRADAEAKLAEIQAELAAGAFVDDGSMRVRDLDEMFRRVRADRWEPSTAEWYRQKLSYVVRAIGHRKAAQVTGGTMTALYAGLRDQGLSGTTVAGVHRAARAMFRAGVKWGYLRADPTDRAEPPRKDTDEMHTWTADELRYFLAETVDEQWHPAWLVLAMTGMRRSELCGLEWSNVDLKAGTITVTKKATSVSGHRHVGEPKTRRSRRTFSIDAQTVGLLRAWRDRGGVTRVGWVAAWDDGSPVDPDVISKSFRRASDRLGMPRIRLHDLRHGWATLALEAGVHIRVVADRLGHASPAVTLDVYSHAAAKADQEAADAVAGLVFREG